jgi:hypothetical protein
VTEIVFPDREAIPEALAKVHVPLAVVVTESVPALMVAPTTGVPSSETTVPEKGPARAKVGARRRASEGFIRRAFGRDQ